MLRKVCSERGTSSLRAGSSPEPANSGVYRYVYDSIQFKRFVSPAHERADHWPCSCFRCKERDLARWARRKSQELVIE